MTEMASESTRPILHCSGLTKSYRRRSADEEAYALLDFDLVVKPGESILLVGPNGAGKSTALRMMAGIEIPTRGSVSIDGQKPRSLLARRCIGFLPDGSDLFPFLDARETLSFFAAAGGVKGPEAKARIAASMERFGLIAYGKKRASTYSAGMRRRLGLAVATLNEPGVLLLDEPTTALDPAGRRLFEEVVGAELERGAALCFSSHHLGAAQAIADRIVVLSGGRTVMVGESDDIAEAIGSTDLTVNGLDDVGVESLVAKVADLGGSVTSRRASERGLEDHLLSRDESEE